MKEKYAKYLPHSGGRYAAKRFRKAQCPIVERLTNSMMMHGRNNGKKLMTVRIVKHAFEIIHLLTGEVRPLRRRARGSVGAPPVILRCVKAALEEGKGNAALVLLPLPCLSSFCCLGAVRGKPRPFRAGPDWSLCFPESPAGAGERHHQQRAA